MTTSSDNQPGKQDSGLPPMVSIAGFSDSGKTTLIERLIPGLRRLGITVGTVKHDVHGFDIDKPGKDSYRHKQAGAAVALISSPQRVGMVMDVDHDQTPAELCRYLPPVDLVLLEGYKRSAVPKIEIYRPEVSGDTPVCRDDPNLIAMVTDQRVDMEVPQFARDDIDGLAHFLVRHFNLVS
jgi:molybdopterin-guanine dinucleotide biosynthesis protein B